MWRILGNKHTPAIGTLKSKKLLENINEESLPGGWYEKFGYLPVNPSKKYIKAVKYLSTITIGNLEEIYKNYPRVLDLLQECFEFAADIYEKIDKSECLFSCVIEKLDEHIKNNTIEEKTHILFHKIKRFFLTSPGEYPSDDEEEAEWKYIPLDKYYFKKSTRNTFEGFQACLEIIEYSYYFYKIYD